MPFTVYVTEDGSVAGAAPVLIVTNDQSLPEHPHGQSWRWAFTSSEEPHKALIGPQLVRKLKVPGWAITDSPLNRLLRVRPATGPSPRYDR